MALLIGAAAEKIEAQLARRRARGARRTPLERAVEIAARTRAGRATPCCWRRPAPASTSLKITSIAGAFSSNWFASSSKRTRRNGRSRARGSKSMPRQLETDRWLFLSTWPCAWSAPSWCSAPRPSPRATVRQRLPLPAAPAAVAGFGLAGMIAVMNVDYRKLREPRLFSRSCSPCW